MNHRLNYNEILKWSIVQFLVTVKKLNCFRNYGHNLLLISLCYY